MNIELDGSEKALNPCKVCGSVVGTLRPGTGPHAKRIDCGGCGRFHNWLSMTTAVAMGLYEKCDDGC